MSLRHRLTNAIAGGPIALGCLFVLAMPGVGHGQDRTVWDGAYSAAQASRGREIYGERCAGCHAADLSGGQGFALKGDRFLDRWRDDSLEALFGHLTTMPMDEDLAPAGPFTRLSDAVYLDLLAHILDTNDFPAGDAELNMDSLSTTRLVGRDGPRPLPSGSTVLVVGCLREATDGVWMLEDSSEPIRSRRLVGTTEEELRASGTLPSTDQSYQLRNLDVRGFDPLPSVGQKVQVKGELIRETGRDRVFVTAFDVVSPSCVP